MFTSNHDSKITMNKGIVDQIYEGVEESCGNPVQPCETDPDQAFCKHRQQVDVIQLDPKLSVGPTFARHLGHRLYRGEYYAMQIDAHVTFVKDWDFDIIQQIDATGNDMAILSTYLSDIEGAINEETGKSKLLFRPIMVRLLLNCISAIGIDSNYLHFFMFGIYIYIYIHITPV